MFMSDNIDFFEREYLIKANKVLMLPDDALKTLIETAAQIKEDAYLCKLFWHCRYLIFQAQVFDSPWDFYFPSLEEYMGKTAAMFSAVVLVSGLFMAVEFNKARNISDDITNGTFSDLKLWLESQYLKHGNWGLGLSSSDKWLIYHFTNRLYKIGRLQFVLQPFNGSIKVYRRVKDNKIIALSESGLRYRSDGQMDGTNNVFDQDGAWISHFEEDKYYIKGNMISPYGHAVKKIIKLPVNEWIEVLSRGDTVLDFHIPAGAKLDHEICGESFRMAKAFYMEHFPEKPFSAYTCRTWFFDPQLVEILPALSNIVKFQREFYLHPVLGSDQGTLDRVFGGRPDDLSKASRDTTLRRAILDYMVSGGHMHDEAGFILKEDMDWGREVYQKTH